MHRITMPGREPTADRLIRGLEAQAASLHPDDELARAKTLASYLCGELRRALMQMEDVPGLIREERGHDRCYLELLDSLAALGEDKGDALVREFAKEVRTLEIGLREEIERQSEEADDLPAMRREDRSQLRRDDALAGML